MVKAVQKKKGGAPKGNKFAVGNKGGRPTSYRPEYAEQAQQLCQFGATDIELAQFFKVDVKTIYNWQATHKEFFQAMGLGKEPANNRVKRSFYQRACGYEYKERHGIKHVPGDVTAQMKWLCNRLPKEWREKIEHTHEVGRELTSAEALEDLVSILVRNGVQLALPPPAIEGESEEQKTETQT
jgi:hypothetical protein